MAVQYILSTDKLQSGFRAKYNTSVGEIITGFTDNGNGTVTATKFDGGIFTINFTTSFYTKSEISALLSGLVVGILIDDISDIDGNYDASADGLPEFPLFTIYDNAGQTASFFFNNTTKIISGMPQLTAFTAKFSAL